VGSTSPAAARTTPTVRLTERQLDVLRYVREDKSNSYPSVQAGWRPLRRDWKRLPRKIAARPAASSAQVGASGTGEMWP